MAKDHSDSESANLLPPYGLVFPISSKGSFICTIPQTEKHIPHPLFIPVVEHWLEREMSSSKHAAQLITGVCAHDRRML